MHGQTVFGVSFMRSACSLRTDRRLERTGAPRRRARPPARRRPAPSTPGSCGPGRRSRSGRHVDQRRAFGAHDHPPRPLEAQDPRHRLRAGGRTRGRTPGPGGGGSTRPPGPATRRRAGRRRRQASERVLHLGPGGAAAGVVDSRPVKASSSTAKRAVQDDADSNRSTSSPAAPEHGVQRDDGRDQLGGGHAEQRPAPSGVSDRCSPCWLPSWRIDTGPACRPPATAPSTVGGWRRSGMATMSSGSSKLTTTVRWRDGRPWWTPGAKPRRR